MSIHIFCLSILATSILAIMAKKKKSPKKNKSEQKMERVAAFFVQEETWMCEYYSSDKRLIDRNDSSHQDNIRTNTVSGGLSSISRARWFDRQDACLRVCLSSLSRRLELKQTRVQNMSIVFCHSCLKHVAAIVSIVFGICKFAALPLLLQIMSSSWGPLMA